MKTFCYHARDVDGKRLFGGMIHAESMDAAASLVIKQSKLQVLVCGEMLPTYHLERNGKKIDLYLSVHPENVGLAQAAVRQTTNDGDNDAKTRL